MADSTMPVYLAYKLTLRAPAILSLCGGSEGAVTQHFIPGSVIRGAFAARLLSQGVGGETDEFRSMVLSGDVRFLHAYPEIEGARSMPTPLSWRSEKADPSYVYDLAAFSGDVSADAEDDDLDDFWPQEAIASPPGSFLAASGSTRTVAGPRVDGRIHHQRDRLKGRSWKDSKEQSHGALFACEYLEAEQVFHGVVQLMPAASEQRPRIEALLKAPIWVGRSRRAGYGGHAFLEFGKPLGREYDGLSDLLSEDVKAGDLFRVVLASAYVGRHRMTGQLDPVALRLELGSRLGARVERTRWAFETVGGFNRKWRLEVPQAQAVAAGAVLVLKAESKIPSKTLLDIEHSGLGERKAEGFGRVLFLRHSEDRGSFPIASPKPDREKVGSVFANEHCQQLNQLETRIVLAAARAELDRIAAIDIAAKAQKCPNSLLGRIRTPFRGALQPSEALARAETWCSDGEGRNVLKKSARDHLNGCSVGHTTLRDWLRQLGSATNGQTWKALVRASADSHTLTSLAERNYLTTKDNAQSILERHSAELCVYFADAVLSAMARMNRRGQQ